MDYSSVDSSFKGTPFHKVNKIASYFIADGILVLLLFIINILIFIKVTKAMKYKKNLKGNSAKSSSEILNAEKSIKLMVFVGSFNIIIGKFPCFVYYLIDTILEI